MQYKITIAVTHRLCGLPVPELTIPQGTGREPTLLFVNCKWKLIRDKHLFVQCSVLESAPKQSEIEVALRCKNESVTMLCRRFVCFVCGLSCISLTHHCQCHAVVIIVSRFTVGLLINGKVISLPRSRFLDVTQRAVFWINGCEEDQTVISVR